MDFTSRLPSHHPSVEPNINKALEDGLPLILVIGFPSSKQRDLIFTGLLPREKKRKTPQLIFVNDSYPDPKIDSYLPCSVSVFASVWEEKFSFLESKFDLVYVNEDLVSERRIDVTYSLLDSYCRLLKDDANCKLIVPNVIVENHSQSRSIEIRISDTYDVILKPLLVTTNTQHVYTNYKDYFDAWIQHNQKVESCIHHQFQYIDRSSPSSCLLVHIKASYELCFFIEGIKGKSTTNSKLCLPKIPTEEVQSMIDAVHHSMKDGRKIVLVLGAVPSEEDKFDFSDFFPDSTSYSMFFVDNYTFSGTTWKDSTNRSWKGRIIQDDIHWFAHNHRSDFASSFDLIITDTGVGHFLKLTVSILQNYISLLKPKGRLILGYTNNSFYLSKKISTDNFNRRYCLLYGNNQWIEIKDLQEPFPVHFPLMQMVRNLDMGKSVDGKLVYDLVPLYPNYESFLRRWFQDGWSKPTTPSIAFHLSNLFIHKNDDIPLFGYIEIVAPSLPLQKGGRKKSALTSRKKYSSRIRRSKKRIIL